MKKMLSLMFIFFLFPISAVNPQERADVVESFTPSSAMLFMKTARIKNLLESLNFVAQNLLTQEIADKLNKKKEEFKAKTGIDPLDVESLKKAGIDIDRTASFAVFPSGRRDENRFLLLLPVRDDKIFPLKFVEILKKMSGSETLDLYPIITDYRGRSIFQVRKDIFSTAFDGSFILASTGELLRGVIDVKENNVGHLSIDPKYSDYLGKTKKNYDVRVFVTRDFLKSVVSSAGARDKKIRDKKKTGGTENDKKAGGSYLGESVRLREVQYVPAADEEKNSEKKSELDSLSHGPSIFNAVDYASLGVTVKPANIDLDLAVQFNNTSASVNTFLDLAKPGMSDKALLVKNAATFAYVSIDFTKMEELCKSGGRGCSFYAEFKNEVHNDLGIDFEKDFVPYFSGVINVIASQARGAGGGYVIYLSMSDPGRNKAIWDKMALYLKDKYKGTDRFGYGKIGAADSFWYIDSKNSKIYTVFDKRGFYIGNETELINVALASKQMKDAPASDDLIKRMGGNAIFLASIKKESFFGALIMLQAYRTKELGALLEKMTDIYVIGEKLDHYLSIDVTIKLMRRK